jgi:NADH-quinone oxidoreductase subunit E
MLQEEELRLIRGEVESWPDKRAALCEALMIVQEHRGWVPDEAVKDIAAELGMNAAEVESIATFYELVFRKPVGRHVILICDGVSCRVTGYREVLERLKLRLGIDFGQTTPDGSFTLLPAGCLGLCEQAPAMTIDGEVFGNLTPDGVEQALEKYVRRQGGNAAHV